MNDPIDIQFFNNVVWVGSLKYDSMHVASPDELTQYATEIAAAKTAYYSAHQTALWTALQADIDAYPALKTAFTNAIASVTDGNTKTALNAARALIQNLEATAIDLKHVVGQGQQMEAP